MAPFEPFETAARRSPSPSPAVAIRWRSRCWRSDWAAARGGRVARADRRSRPAAGVGAGSAERRASCCGGLGIEAAILRWAGAEARSRPAGGGARRPLPAAVRGVPPPRHPPSAGGASCRRPGRDRSPMRAARGSGPDGLAGMAALVERPRRPPAAPAARRCPRARLTATLAGARRRRGSTIRRTSIRASSARACARTGAILAGQPDADRVRRRAGEIAAGRGGGRDARVRAGRRASRIDRTAFVPPGRRTCSAAAEPGRPGRRRRRSSAAARPARPGGCAGCRGRPMRGKSGKGQDFTLSGCQLDAASGCRHAAGCAGLSGPKMAGDRNGQPLVPAAFFACGAGGRTHLRLKPHSTEMPCEPVQS